MKVTLVMAITVDVMYDSVGQYTFMKSYDFLRPKFL